MSLEDREEDRQQSLKTFPVKSTPQKYETWAKKFKEQLELERSTWNLYCNWNHPADIISIGARHRVIVLTQILGDGKEFLKKIQDRRQEQSTSKKS